MYKSQWGSVGTCRLQKPVSGATSLLKIHISYCKSHMLQVRGSYNILSTIALYYTSISVCTGNQLTMYRCLPQELNISHCLNVTDEGVQSVVTQCPWLSILVFHGCPLLTSLSRDIASNGRQMKQLTWTIY